MPPKTLENDRLLDRNHALLFKQLLQNYENKEYKKGVKNADQILKRYPNHGETMAMKGLILTNIDRKEEGWECVRKGLRNDLKSHICWHVYGLLYRADRNYEESMKCYVNALKFDPDNLVVLRDLAVIQSQLRLFPGLVETRRSLVLRQPDVRGHHTALAVSHHLNKDFVNAEKVLREFDEKLVIRPKNNPEHSMTTLYMNTVIAESGNYKGALIHLNSIQQDVLDKLEILQRRAAYELKLENFDAAVAAFEKLLDINPDCHRYYKGLEQALRYRTMDGLVISEKIDLLTALYERLQERYPKSNAAKRLPLDWLSGNSFQDAMDKYLRLLLQKGIPSTFVDVKSLYKDDKKAVIIEALAESYLASLGKEENASFKVQTNGHSASNTVSEQENEPPTSYLWTLYFLAQSHDLRRNLTRATDLIEEAINHTPTLVELHLTKARILKHSGSPKLAAEQMNIARELDLQDRFINTKSAKYYLRSDQNGEALNVISCFINSTLGGGSIGDLQEMQSIRYLAEDGLSYQRQSLLGLALKRFDSVKRAVDQWYEDEFDFHQYCFRKGTIDAYIQSMRFEDTLYKHPVYAMAACGAVECLLSLHRNPDLKTGPPEKAEWSDADRKKEKKRIQKIRARCAKDATKEADKKDGIDMHRKIDDDPVGDKLVGSQTPLEDALTYLKPWLRDAPDNQEAWLLAAEVYVEQGNLGEAIKALNHITVVDRHYLMYRLYTAYHRAQSIPESTKSEFSSLCKDEKLEGSIQVWNDSFLQNITTTRGLIAGVKVAIESGAMPEGGLEQRILIQKLDMRTTTLAEARELYSSLTKLDSGHKEEMWTRIKSVWYNVDA